MTAVTLLILPICYSQCFAVFDPHCQRFLSTESTQTFDWENLRGWTEIPTAPLLNEEQIERLYSALKAEYQEDFGFVEHPQAPAYRWQIKNQFDADVADLLVSYIDELANLVKKNVPGHLAYSISIRTEHKNSSFASGHRHFGFGVNFSLALTGEPTWIQVEGARIEPAPQNTLVFTDQFHGSPNTTGRRVAIIVSFYRKYK